MSLSILHFFCLFVSTILCIVYFFADFNESYFQKNTYDLRKGDLCVLSWAKVLMCGGGVRSILLLPLVARCIKTIDVCIYIYGACLFLCLWGSVVKFVV